MNASRHTPYYLESEYREQHDHIFVSKKLGWENAQLLSDNAQVIAEESQQWILQAISISAIREWRWDKNALNTTNTLIHIWKLLVQWDKTSAIWELNKIYELHERVINTEYQHDPAFLSRLQKYIKNTFGVIAEYIQAYDAQMIPTKENDYCFLSPKGKKISLLWLGEYFSAKIHTFCLKHEWINARYIDTNNIWSEWSVTPTVLKNFLREQIIVLLQDDPSTVPVLPGYFSGAVWGILNMYGRWYTDAHAERVAIAMSESEGFTSILNIQKMEDGFCDTDPRKLDNKWDAQVIEEISYDLTGVALKKSWAFAWLIQDQAFTQELQNRNIQVLVNNPHSSNSGTKITRQWPQESEWVDMVLSREKHDKFPLDEKRFWKWVGIVIENGIEVDRHQVICILGENLGNLSKVFHDASEVLKSADIIPLTSYLDTTGKNAILLVFKNKSQTAEAQKLLHNVFLKNKKTAKQAA